jgi:hypothetical protein
MFLLGAALVGCADDPVSHPGVVWRTLPHDDPNAVCIAETGLAAGGLIFVAATVPPAGVAAWFFYGASSFIAGMDTARCSEAADVYEPPFDVAFSCDGGVHIWTETFTRIYDVGVSMSHTFCFTEGSSGGGGGGGGGGW